MNDKKWLKYTIALSKKCPATDSAFAVGAAIVDAHDKLIIDGFSRETDLTIHAEESALGKIRTKNLDLTQATLYSSLEPCNIRLSKPKGCAQLIIESGIKRVVFAATEPALFVPGLGAQKLTDAGIDVVILPEFTPAVIAAQSQTIQKQWKRVVL